MSNGRKSFLLHFDSLGILDQLTDEQCGKLLLAFRDYNLGEELKLDATLELVFFPFKAQFIRDQEKYQIVQERNRINGSKGGRPKNPTEPKEPTGISGNPTEPRKGDSGSGSGSGNNLKDYVADAPVDRKKSAPPYQQIVAMYNEILGGEFKGVIKIDVTGRKAKIKKFWLDMGKEISECERYFHHYNKKAEAWERGQGNRNWTADIEHIIKDKTVERMRAG